MPDRFLPDHSSPDHLSPDHLSPSSQLDPADSERALSKSALPKSAVPKAGSPKTGALDQRHPVEEMASKIIDQWQSDQWQSDHVSPDATPVTTDRPTPTMPRATCQDQPGETDHETLLELEALLPVIERLESARRAHQQRPAGLASLGGERPEQLGDYLLRRQIGRGGMGVVYEAKQISLDRQVAVKVLPPSLLQDAKQVERFQKEARLAASLHHTNIVPVFGVGHDDGYHYYVMQRIHGESLDCVIDRLIAEDRSMPVDEVLSIGIQAADALHYAHQHGADGSGILHRDIKPANLMLAEDETLWVMDFGVAKAIETVEATLATDPIGTLRYMAPEQAVGENDPRSDLYSLGLTLYELLTGQPAIPDPLLRASWMKQGPRPEPTKLRTINRAFSIDLETVIHKAIATDPDDRYESAEAFADDLRCIESGLPISAKRHSTIGYLHRWAKRRPLVAALTAVSLLLLGTVAVTAAVGYFQVQRSLTRAVAAEANSRKTADVATEALDRLFHRFADSGQDLTSVTTQQDESNLPAMGMPAISPHTAQLLQEMLPYYDRLSRLQDGDSSASSSSASSSASDSVDAARLHLANLHFRLGNFSQATEAFTASLKRRLSQEDALASADLLNQIGQCYALSGDQELANQRYQSALDLLGDSKNQNDLERFAAARTHYLMGFRSRPGNTPESFPPSIAFQERVSARAADDRVDEVPNDNSRHSDQQLKSLSTCLGLIETLWKESPSNPTYRVLLAMTCRELEEDLLQPPDDPKVRYGDRAIEILEQLYGNDPGSVMIRWELAKTLADFNVFRAVSLPSAELGIERLDRSIELVESLLRERPGVTGYELAMVHLHFKRSQLREQVLHLRHEGESFRGPPGWHDDFFRWLDEGLPKPGPQDRAPPRSGSQRPNEPRPDLQRSGRKGPPREYGPGPGRGGPGRGGPSRGGPGRGEPGRGGPELASLDSQIISDIRAALRGIDSLIHDQPGAKGYRAWKAMFQWKLAQSLLRKRELDRAKLTIDRSAAAFTRLKKEAPDVENRILEIAMSAVEKTRKEIIRHPEYQDDSEDPKPQSTAGTDSNSNDE